MLQSIRNSVSRLWGDNKARSAKSEPAREAEAVVVGFVDAPKAAYAVTVTGSFVQFSKEALAEEMKKQRPMNS